MTWWEKITSRKFLLCLAAFLGSLGTGITGLAVGNETVAIVGGILTVVSAAIYAACEAYVDGASLKSNTVGVNINATNSKESIPILDKVMAPAEVKVVEEAKETK